MREGLNPIETGKKLYEHGEEQKSEEEHGQDTAEDRHSRIVQIGEAVLLALVTLTAAYIPQYKLPEQAQANALDNDAAAKFNAGNAASLVSDNYVRITVFLAAVLFLVGIGSSFMLHGVRYALITLGSVLLVVSVVLILRQPGLPAS